MVTNNKLNFNSSEFTHIEFSGNKVFFFGDDYYTGCEEKISLKEELKIKS